MDAPQSDQGHIHTVTVRTCIWFKIVLFSNINFTIPFQLHLAFNWRFETRDGSQDKKIDKTTRCVVLLKNFGMSVIVCSCSRACYVHKSGWHWWMGRMRFGDEENFWLYHEWFSAMYILYTLWKMATSCIDSHLKILFYLNGNAILLKLI